MNGKMNGNMNGQPFIFRVLAMTNQMKANTNGNMNGTKTVQKLNFFSNSPSVQFFFYSIVLSFSSDEFS
jgi:hypothetical protein